MKISYTEFEGTPDEFRALPEHVVAQFAQRAAPMVHPDPGDDAGTRSRASHTGLDDELADYIRSRARSREDRELMEQYASEVLSWDRVYAEIGSSERTEDGFGPYFMVKLAGSGLGAAVYAHPGTGRLVFRLQEPKFPDDLRYAYERDVKEDDSYKFSLNLTDEHSLHEAFDLTREAIDGMRRE